MTEFPSPPFDEGRVAPPATRVEPPQATIAEIVVDDGGRELAPRTAEDDERVALHEACHALTGRVLGSPLGGIHVIPAMVLAGCVGDRLTSPSLQKASPFPRRSSRKLAR
jgi:hypothetical protein